MKSITIRILDSEGKPKQDSLISILFHHPFMLLGKKRQITDSHGCVEFLIYIDDVTEISIYVDDEEKLCRATLQPEYQIIL